MKANRLGRTTWTAEELNAENGLPSGFSSTSASCYVNERQTTARVATVMPRTNVVLPSAASSPLIEARALLLL